MLETPFLQLRSPHGIYDVVFGPIEARLNFLRLSRSHCVVIIDKNVANLHKERLSQFVSQMPCFVFSATEENKSLDELQNIFHFLQANQCTRYTKVLVIGGGIVQDVSAFACHTFFRGIEWELFPTTVLSMADSCVGGKCGVNFDKTKNLIGAFEYPRRVTIDTQFATSLSPQDVLSGLAETLKSAIISGESALEELCKNWASTPEQAKLEPLIRQSLLVKKDFVEEDPLDHGKRRMLNYGHTFGHALESATNYAVPHGIAVACGIDLVNYLAVRLGVMQNSTFLRLHSIIKQRFGTKVSISATERQQLIDKVCEDKKRLSNGVYLALVKSPGDWTIKLTPIDSNLIDAVMSYSEWDDALVSCN